MKLFKRQNKHLSFFSRVWKTTLVILLVNSFFKSIIKKNRQSPKINNSYAQQRSWREHRNRQKYFRLTTIDKTTVKKIPIVSCNHTFTRKSQKLKGFAVLLVISLVSILSHATFNKYTEWFKASLTTHTVVEFEGTTMPVKKVPNWSVLTEAERKMSFNQLPKSKIIPIPAYDTAAMKRGMTWRPDNQADRNTYITYPVAHAGNYKLDATENAGSHPGIDIKIPIGTPIYAYAAGVVTKVDFQSTGFGHHIVIEHPNVPDPDNSSQKTNLYSSYSHLSKTQVTVGQIVTKGQQIGLSGNTGMATAPHLHFQIDRANAPFYPYWPFTWKDVQASPGVTSYFDAVNKKLGQSKLFTHTVHPIAYHQKHQNFIPTTPRILAEADSTPTPVTTTVAIDDVRTSVIAQAVRSTPETSTAFSVTNTDEIESRNPSVVSTTRPSIAPVTVAQTQSSSLAVNGRLEIEAPNEFIPGKKHVVTFVTENPNLVASAGIELSSTLKNNAIINPSRLTVADFADGKATVSVLTDSSHMYRLIATGNFGEMKSPTIRSQIFPDVGSNHPNQAAIKYVKDSGIFTGDGNGNFNPDEPLNRAAAVKVLLEANNISTSRKSTDLKFLDVRSSDWFYDYVKEAASRKIVKGYDDGSFRGAQSVNRAEFMKMILETKGIVPRGLTGQPYLDVPEDSWFVDLFRFAKAHDLFPNSEYVQPGAFVTRKEVAEIIYKLRNVR